MSLSAAARKLPANLPRLPDNPWGWSNLNGPWLVCRAWVGLEDVHTHDLRTASLRGRWPWGRA